MYSTLIYSLSKFLNFATFSKNLLTCLHRRSSLPRRYIVSICKRLRKLRNNSSAFSFRFKSPRTFLAFSVVWYPWIFGISSNTAVRKSEIAYLCCDLICIPWHECTTATFPQNCHSYWQPYYVSSVDKKNQLDVTFCVLYFSSNSCSTCFGQPCAHHQELTTAWCYSLVLVCAVAAGRWSSPVGR